MFRRMCPVDVARGRRNTAIDARQLTDWWEAERPASFTRRFRPISERGRIVEHASPLGTLWAGLGLGAFYLALTWVNLLLGHFLTPLFLIPLTWLQDAAKAKKG